METNKKKDICVVIPVYNSEDCVFELVAQLGNALKGFSYQIIMVNDRSPDKSWDKICEASRMNKNLTGVNLRRNSGQDNAIMAGLTFAASEYIVIMDDDLQHSPRDIPNLYAEISKGFDVCYAKFSQKKQSWWKNLGSWFNGKIAEKVLAKPRDIYLSPYKIISAGVVDEILKYNGIFPYIDGLIFKITTNISQIPAEHQARFKGKSNYNLVRSAIVFMKLFTGFSVMPLRTASFMGFFSAIAGFGYGIFNVWSYFYSERIVEGWTTITVLILFIGGLILLSLGLIGEYIGRIYLGSNFRLQYSIREIVDGKGNAANKKNY